MCYLLFHSKVLHALSIDVVYMLGSKHALIWQTLGVQIEEGHLQLKQVEYCESFGPHKVEAYVVMLDGCLCVMSLFACLSFD